ncbi:MAG: glycogen/starch/alpha-glucan phosphorylase [Opitutales bacterium]
MNASSSIQSVPAKKGTASGFGNVPGAGLILSAESETMPEGYSPKTPKKKAKPFKFNIESDTEGLKTSILNHLKYSLARDVDSAQMRDWWLSASYAVRDRVLARFIATQSAHNEQNVRRVYYLSMEYLIGRLLEDNLNNTGLLENVRTALEELGQNPREVFEQEVDMGLGNGGLGRLAACFLDSLATMELPAIGYGIQYEFGLFRQEFVEGRQIEKPDNWQRSGNPWQIERPEYAVEVPLMGHVEYHFDDKGDWYPAWVNHRSIIGVPWDVPIVGYGANTINFLRLWESRASQEFDLEEFNRGDYVEAVRQKAISETVSKVLYPNDKTENGKELRLVQQYFFVSCSLHDIIRRYQKHNEGWDNFPEKVAIQLNDTHPAVAVPELMRIFLDEYGIEWDAAWGICRKVFAYTNHTLLPEALEKWSVPLFERLLPRHLQIIYEINRRFLEDEVEAHWPGDDARKSALSIIEEGEPKMIRMAYLSVVASHAVNGVAALHTRLLREDLFNAFDQLFPGKLQNKTNGITPRRWLKACNPRLSRLITDSLGDENWVKDLDRLRQLEPLIEDAGFRKEYAAVKRQNKIRLAGVIQECMDISVDPGALFDVQIKRLHEYKRQHLNLLHILSHYRRILHQPDYNYAPRVYVFAAKAAPGYELAKTIIHAINAVAARVNNDQRVGDRLKVCFLPNYSVTLAEHIIPAADLSEQISTAGKEASGTGNMKLALNGALTIGTLDGANVEIREEVGDENIFIFGKTVEEVEALRASGYNPWDLYNSNEELKACLDWLTSGYFCEGDPGAFDSLRHSLLDGGDPFLVLADFQAYIDCQAQVSDAYQNADHWVRMAALNTARVGKFSSDRTIGEYAEQIWNLKPVQVK